MLVRAARTALQAGLEPVFAVVREARWQPLLAPMGVQVLVNEEAEEGMASSVRVGVNALARHAVQGAVFLTCDQPLLQAAHLLALCAQRDRVTGSAYAGRVGVPAYFPAAVFPALLGLQGDTGARALLLGAFVIPNQELALDIDTEADLRAAAEHFR